MAYRIYLVDDDRFLLDLYAMKFKNSGHEVQSFSSGEDLISALKKEGAPMPDGILLDVIMPGVDGFGALEVIRKEGLAKGAKIIMLTNQGQESDVETAKKYGVDGYIIKASAIPSEVFAETIRILERKPV
jgi:two-component system phosphate regulon response regulator PhoB